ncbi:MAG: hypothetical protein K2J60_19405 [Acetatifactor sp.]|nr:hypothetical protein [Acetatifactor sp.]
MENRKSLLKSSSIEITPNLSVRIPAVGEILEDEQRYYSLISTLTATPFQYMVQLDDMGFDFTKINDYQLFTMLFPSIAQGDISILFGDLDLSDISIRENRENNTFVLYSSKNDITIDKFIYTQIADCIRKINCLTKENRKPGNDEAKEFRINLERKKQKRNAGKPYEPYLEKLVIALVNRPEFKYNYEQVNQLTIYQFNQSFEQIKTSISFDNTMIGVYAGTVDTSRIKDRSCLSWIPVKH